MNGRPNTAALAHDEVLTAEQVADLLKLNTDYIRKKSREGVIPCHRLPGGRTFRYLRSELLAWLRALPASDDRP